MWPAGEVQKKKEMLELMNTPTIVREATRNLEYKSKLINTRPKTRARKKGKNARINEEK